MNTNKAEAVGRPQACHAGDTPGTDHHGRRRRA